MTEVKWIPLKMRCSEVAEIDIKKCIICQIDTNESTCSNAQAWTKIPEAARIRDALITHWPIIGRPIIGAKNRPIQKVPETGQKPAVHTV